MGRRRRRRSPRTSGRSPGASEAERPQRARTPLLSWRERLTTVFTDLRTFARERAEPEIEAHLRGLFAGEDGDPSEPPPVPDLERAFDDYCCWIGGAGEGRSLVRAFAEEAHDLAVDERAELPGWELERRRKVYVLDRAHPDRLELWDPLAAGRVVLHLLHKMARGHAAGLARGTVVIATSVPWNRVRVAVGALELFDDAEALQLYRREVQGSGRIWHDLPAPTPASGAPASGA